MNTCVRYGLRFEVSLFDKVLDSIPMGCESEAPVGNVCFENDYIPLYPVSF